MLSCTSADKPLLCPEKQRYDLSGREIIKRNFFIILTAMHSVVDFFYHFNSHKRLVLYMPVYYGTLCFFS